MLIIALFEPYAPFNMDMLLICKSRAQKVVESSLDLPSLRFTPLIAFLWSVNDWKDGAQDQDRPFRLHGHLSRLAFVYHQRISIKDASSREVGLCLRVETSLF